MNHFRTSGCGNFCFLKRTLIGMRQMAAYLFLCVLAAVAACQKSEPDVRVERIACIGTSITDGFVLPINQTYPYQLQTLIGPAHKVLNYGVGGCTVLKKGDKPYWQAEKYQFALNWKPTIVVVEFGTNDSKPQNWQYKSEFKNDYIALIQSFQKLSSSPKVYICLPPPAATNTFDIDPAVLKNDITPVLNEVAKELNLPVIDLYKPMLSKSSLFIDGIHPTPEGADTLAHLVYRGIGVK